MRKLGQQGVQITLSLVCRLWKWIVHDITAGLRDAQQWCTRNIPPAVVLVTEKWLGFCYAFVVTFIVGFLGMSLLETARWASNQPELASTVPRLILGIGGIAFFVLLLWGIIQGALLIVSAIRVLFWIRNTWIDYWNGNTPPYSEPASGSDPHPWPPSNDEIAKAKEKAGQYFWKGAIWFPIITLILFQIEMNFSDQLYPVIRNTNWSVITNSMNTTFSIVDIGGLIEAVGLPLNAISIIGFIFSFVFPGILISLSTRNLLYVTEANVREKINKSSTGSKLEWRRIWLLVQVIVTVMYAVAVLYGMLYGT